MARLPVPGTAVERLAHDLFDGATEDPLAEELFGAAGRVAAVPRVRRGASRKDRKKLRGALDAEARRDVRAELGGGPPVAGGSAHRARVRSVRIKQAGPDFTVTWRGAPGFNLEVTRLRRAPDTSGHGGQLLAKLRQLPPSLPNVVVVAIEGETAEAFDVPAVTRTLRARADTKDEAFFTARGFDGTRLRALSAARCGPGLCERRGRRGARDAVEQWIGPDRAAERAARACLACLRDG